MYLCVYVCEFCVYFSPLEAICLRHSYICSIEFFFFNLAFFYQHFRIRYFFPNISLIFYSFRKMIETSTFFYLQCCKLGINFNWSISNARVLIYKKDPFIHKKENIKIFWKPACRIRVRIAQRKSNFFPLYHTCITSTHKTVLLCV